jgi:hypothetical protein
MMTSGMYLVFAVGGNPVVSILGYVLAMLVREADKPASFARRTKKDHFLVALVRPDVGLAAGRVGGAEANLGACASTPFTSAYSEGKAQPELQGSLERRPWHARDLANCACRCSSTHECRTQRRTGSLLCPHVRWRRLLATAGVQTS